MQVPQAQGYHSPGYQWHAPVQLSIFFLCLYFLMGAHLTSITTVQHSIRAGSHPGAASFLVAPYLCYLHTYFGVQGTGSGLVFVLVS
jgi:hypothetical protein